MGHDMEALVWETAEELDKKLAERMRRIRRRRKVSQQKLSDMSGVSYGSIKRFETDFTFVTDETCYGVGTCR